MPSSHTAQMVTRIALLFLPVSIHAALPFGGCPCISELPPMNTSGATAVMDGKRYDVSHLLQMGYGVGCAAHDANQAWCEKERPDTVCDGTVVPVPAACLAAQGPTWCGHEWCYVQAGCNIEYQSTAFFADSPPLVFSYATCGYTDDFSTGPMVRDALMGKVLRAGWLSNTGGWRGAYHPTGVHGTRDELWRGPIVSLLSEAAARGGFALNISTAPPEVLAMSGIVSSFTRCTYAVSLGYLDLCVGSLTMTTERTSMTPFQVVDIDPFYLVVPQETQRRRRTLREAFVLILSPFGNSAWVCVVLFMILVSIMFLVQEYGLPGSEWGRISSTGVGSRRLSHRHGSYHYVLGTQFGAPGPDRRCCMVAV